MKKHPAFTYMEVLLAMTIIGIIFTLGLRSLDIVDRNVKYIYSNIYYSLDRAYRTAMGTVTSETDPFKDGLSDDDGSVRLCKLLTTYITPVEPESQRCQAGRLMSIRGDGFDKNGAPTNVQFTAVNGVRFYLTKKLPTSVSSGEPYFYIIFADVNGEKKPNSMVYERPTAANGHKETDPDIFAFAALENGRICPLGPPEIDPKFMTARILFQTGIDEETNEITFKYTKESKPYYITKAEAWGYYGGYSGVKDATFIEGNPLTYNGYIRKKIKSMDNNSLIYKFLNGKNLGVAFPVPANISLKSGAYSDKAGYDCAIPSVGVPSDEECTVVIDEYAY